MTVDDVKKRDEMAMAVRKHPAVLRAQDHVIRALRFCEMTVVRLLYTARQRVEARVAYLTAVTRSASLEDAMHDAERAHEQAADESSEASAQVEAELRSLQQVIRDISWAMSPQGRAAAAQSADEASDLERVDRQPSHVTATEEADCLWASGQ